ncbi:MULTISPECIES: DUF169 domain-containing protein [Micromonospora]|nr:DUF169 domain-containing protein [Micromonospora craterilacus]
MPQYRDAATEISALLDLEQPPVAVAFVEQVPDGVETTTAVSPSACAFWRRGEQEVFFAAAAQHYNCPVGSMVMGFDMPAEVMQELGGLVETMCGWSYLGAEEGAKIPSVGGNAGGAVYGPLGSFPVTPKAVVMWLTPKQAMVFNEAIGTASWAATPARVGGRPACAAIPLALGSATPTLSFGCIGMRTFTSIADDRMLAVVPGDQIESFTAALRSTAEANGKMLGFYQSRLAAVTAS